MADILIDNQVVPSTPAAGKSILFIHSVSKTLGIKDDSGRTNLLGGCIRNQSLADQLANAADTYLTGSALAVPTGMVLQVGTAFRWRLTCTKTAAGVAAPIWNIRVGINGSTADTARCVFTQVALQTAAIDAAVFDIYATLRNVGAAGVLAGSLHMAHVLAATGFSTLDHNVQQVTSAGFDTTIAGTIVGLSVNPGASGAWTFQVIQSEMANI